MHIKTDAVLLVMVTILLSCRDLLLYDCNVSIRLLSIRMVTYG